MKNHFLTAALAITLGLLNAMAADHGHFSAPPHGGTPVVVGSHGFHLELVRDAEKSRFQAYVIDGHFEHYVSVPEKSFDMVATVGGQEQKITFNRTPAPGGNDAAKDSYSFEGTADWVKTATNFTAVIPTITLKGRTFRNVRVNFPKGSIHRGH